MYFGIRIVHFENNLQLFFFVLFCFLLLVVGKVSMYELYGNLQTVWQICNQKMVMLKAK